MTTSCCAGYNELVDKHLPEMKPFRSDTKTPMYYTAEIVKKENPDAVTVFFSPCVAKKREALNNNNVDFVINYEEVGAWMTAKEIKVAECADSEFKVQSSAEARNYCVTGGVAKAVQVLRGCRMQTQCGRCFHCRLPVFCSQCWSKDSFAGS